MTKPPDTSGLTEASQEAVKYTLRLEAENERLRAAGQAVLDNWDGKGGERERFVEAREDRGGYWSPHSSMIDSECIAGLREALNEQPERKGE